MRATTVAVTCRHGGRANRRPWIFTKIFGPVAVQHFTQPKTDRADGTYRPLTFSVPSFIDPVHEDGRPLDELVSGWNYTVWEFRCPYCAPAAPRIPERRFQQEIDEKRRVGATELDVYGLA